MHDPAEDQFLIKSMLSGDSGALDRLIERYDRLVRYTVFRAARHRCRQDPEWVDSVASDTWAGFVRSMQRNPDKLPDSVTTYLIQVARNRCTDALRVVPPSHESLDDESGGDIAPADEGGQDPLEVAARLEELEILRSCVDDLSDDDRGLYAQLDLITQKRWREAAAALAIPEATLRSRWKKVLGRLQLSIERKPRQG